MEANWNNPTNTTIYTSVLGDLKSRDEDIALGFSNDSGGTLGTNLSVGTIKFNKDTSKWQKYTGDTTWIDLADIYDISVKKLNGQDSSYYRNAGNINEGELSNNRLPGTITANLTGNVTGNILASNDEVILALGTVGTAGTTGTAAVFTGNVSGNATSASSSVYSTGVKNANAANAVQVLTVGTNTTGSDATFTGTAAKATKASYLAKPAASTHTDCITTVADFTLLNIVEAGHERLNGSEVVFSGVEAIGVLTAEQLNQTFAISSVTPNGYTIDVGVVASSPAINGGGSTIVISTPVNDDYLTMVEGEGSYTAETATKLSYNEITGKLSTPELKTSNIHIRHNTISSTNTNGDITLSPKGTGDLVLDGLKFPQSDGTVGQVLKTDGSTQLAWEDEYSYTLPTASNTALGGIKVGANLSIDADGILSSSAGGNTTIAGTNLTYVGDMLNVDEDQRYGSGTQVYTGNAFTYTSYLPNSGGDIRWYVFGSERMRLQNDSDLHVGGNIIAYSDTVSDERLKTAILPITGALSKVSQLNGCTFTYTTDGKKSAGLIAQDVEKVLPSAVSEKELPLKTEDGEKYKVLQYDQTIGLLVEAIKELKDMVDSQALEIKELQKG